VLAAQGRHKDAIEHYVRGSEIRRNLAVADPGNRAWQRDLAIGYDRIGQAHQILGENAEALESYKSSVAVRQKLYLANRRDFTNQHELAGAFEQVGGLRKTLGDSKLALAAYQQSVLLRQELADAYRDNAQLQSELAVSLYLSSTVSEAPAAKDALLKALAVLESLERDQKLTSSQATWPRFIRGEIAKLH
jgi:tetratricopeptide (TPR) repeat protein